MAESVVGSETVSAVARPQGLTASQLFAWRRQACAGSAEVRPMSFPSVVVGSAPVEIVLGGVTIRVPPGGDAAMLQGAVKAVSP